MGLSIDRKKVIKGLEVCTTRPCFCTDCPYKANCILDSQEVMEDALSLLKEQEAEIRQLKLALEISKGTCKGIRMEGR